MKRICVAALSLLWATSAQAQNAVTVTAENYNRAESDASFGSIVKRGAIGKLAHSRNLEPLDEQGVVRANRDTLYSEGVFDLDAGPVTISMPNAGKRYMSIEVIDQDDYVPAFHYGGGEYTLTKKNVGTRYVLPLIRILIDPNDPKDVEHVHALQDKIKVTQKSAGKFEVPNWDHDSLLNVRKALLVLGEGIDSKNMFGARGKVDPVKHLIGSAVGWGGAPEKDALYVAVTPPNAAAFAGGFAEFRYLALERTSNNPLSVTLAFEPNVRLIDETSGERVHNYEFETTVNADIELLRNRLYAGFNLLYEPEVTWTATDDTIREATLGGSAALSLRITPNVLVGGEVWYLRHYDSPTLSAFTGDAIMLGPTMYVQFTPKMFMIAAWNAQVWGREVGNSLPLNLSEFQRQRARLKFAWEF